VDIQLIPKEYQSKSTISRGFKLPIIGSVSESAKPRAKLWLALCIGLLVLSILVYLGLVIYKNSLLDSKVALENQIKDLEAARDLEWEAKLKDLEKGIKDLGKILETHIYSSKLFQMLEELTLSQVQWTGLKATLSEGKIDLNGRAASYSILAKQMVVLEQDPRIIQTETSGIKLTTTGDIEFNLVLKLKPGLLQYEQAYE
jgi:Tfp pilus assembly protein PilN